MLNTKLLGGTASKPAEYVEDVFSTYLWTGNGTTQTLTNGIDLTGKGGMVWRKQRDAAADHFIADTVRGTYSTLSSNTTAAASGSSYIDFLSDGFQAVNSGSSNASGSSQCSWSFRKAPKFFDMVTYTGNQTNRTIAHNLGSVPGMIIVICVSSGGYDKHVYHRSLANTEFLSINTTNAKGTGANRWNSTTATATEFSLGTDTTVNATGDTFIAYLFAHNAGGFGAAGTDNVISCGSFTTGSTGVETITLGYEPQYVMFKRADSTGDWIILDNMRGFSNGSVDAYLYANTSDAETTAGYGHPTATGFVINAGFGSGQTYIYMAIRRPMAVPTVGTTVYQPVIQTGSTNYDVTFTGLSYIDTVINYKDVTPGGTYNFPMWHDRLRGFPINMAGSTYVNNPGLSSGSTAAEGTAFAPDASNYLSGVTMNRAVWGGGWNGYNGVFHGLKRASGFFDEVCYTGTGSGTSPTHNLGVVPELKIIKRRNFAQDWIVGGSIISGVGGRANYALLNTTDAVTVNSTYWDVADTSTTFSVRAGNAMSDTSGGTYVAYLFSTCPGVSKVGSYTGTSSNQTINCGFTGGARFVMIKRTDSTGNWYVFNTASGMVTSNNKKLKMNSSDAQTTADWVLTTTGGFQIVTSEAEVNFNGGSFIYLAIA